MPLAATARPRSASLVHRVSARPGAQDVKPARFNSIENCRAATRKQVDVDGQCLRNSRHQSTAVSEQAAGPFNLKLHHLGKRWREPQRLQVRLRVTEALPIFARQVDSSQSKVACDILPEIRQLKGSAGCVGQSSVLVGKRTSDVQNQMTYRIGRPRAVIEQLVVSEIFRDCLVLFEGRDQRLKGFDRNVITRDRFRQSDHDGMAGFAVIHRPQLVSPPGQELERVSRIADLVSQVVRPATEGVDTLKCGPVGTRSQPGHDSEVLVVACGQACAISECLRT